MGARDVVDELEGVPRCGLTWRARFEPLPPLDSDRRLGGVDSTRVEQRPVASGRDADDAGRELVISGEALSSISGKARERATDVAETGEHEIEDQGRAGHEACRADRRVRAGLYST